MNATDTVIEQPDEIETAWAEHEERQRLIDAYNRAASKAARAAARWDVLAYDMANPGVTKLMDQLDDHARLAA